MQPFIAIGQELASDGHRVRVATHAILRTVVENKGLEFYPLGGDPIKLAEFAVKNKGAALFSEFPLKVITVMCLLPLLNDLVPLVKRTVPCRCFSQRAEGGPRTAGRD